jgi:hypothetical protein
MPLPRAQYQPLPIYQSADEVHRVLREGTADELRVLSLALGEHWHDWKFAQDICLRLADSEDASIRANACLGLAHVARNHLRLEKHLVKPVLIRELRCQTDFRWRIVDAIGDINAALDWQLAHKLDAG